MSDIESLVCPVCDCDVLLGGYEKKGDELFCTECDSPLKYLLNKKTDEPYLKDDN